MNRKIHTCVVCPSYPAASSCPADKRHALPLHRGAAQHLEGGYKYTSSFSLRSKKRMQMGENCSSEARARAQRIMRSECRQECVEEWSWQGFTSLNYSKPIPFLIIPNQTFFLLLFLFFLVCEGVLWRCFCLNIKLKLFLLHEEIRVAGIWLFR